MLPFTKRPGRENENEEEVLTKDNLVKPPASIPPPPRSVPPPARAAQPSLSDDEMTNIMPSKALGSVEAQLEKYASPRPAAGMPPPAASSRPAPASIPPPRNSQRPGKFAADAEDEDGRTVVRGAPKIVKKTNPRQTSNQLAGIPTAPTTISPAAVIKASLESANAGKSKKTGDHLMSPPPADLLEDLADLRPAKPEKPQMDPHPADVGAEHTAILQTTGSNQTLASAGLIQGVQPLSSQQLGSSGLPSGSIPPGSSRPMSAPPPPNSQTFNPAQSGGFAAQSGGYAAQSGGYPAQYSNPVPSASVSVPGMVSSMPAHFMVPQAPYSDGRVDPPGTAVTARTKVKGRAPMSWAVALLAFGVFVGVGWVAVQRGGDGGLETTASFVDPAKAAAPKAAAAPATPTPVAVPTDQPTSVSVPPVAVPATPPPPAAETAAAATPPAAPPPPVAAAPATVAAATPAPPDKPEKPEKPTKKPTVHFAAAPTPAPAPTEKPEKPEKPAKPTKPSAAVAAAAAEEASAPAPDKPAKPGKGTKPTGKGGGEVDEETKKALEALQKSQLESSF